MLAEAQEWLRERVDDGARCPCCTQLAKVYRRSITSGTAAGLIRVYREHGQEWLHIPSTAHLARLGGEFARLRYWGLVVEDMALREDGGRTGWWQVTDLGAAFVRGRVRVPKYARIYDGRLLSLDSAEAVSIHDALNDRFDYHALMEAS